MLSYRHSFHAGCHADVLKHIVLARILLTLTDKDKPLFYLDTHAGQGMYTCHQDGILSLWNERKIPLLLDPYFNIIRQLNDDKLIYYPGSPYIASQLLRAQDRLLLCELHPSDYPKLADLFYRDHRINVLLTDGYAQIKAHVPPISRRGLIFIDPSYETKTELSTLADSVINGYKRFATGVYVIWYPIFKSRSVVDYILRQLKHAKIPNILRIEISIGDSLPAEMIGSGVIVINPPWKLDIHMKAILPWLLQCLGVDNKRYQRVSWFSV